MPGKLAGNRALFEVPADLTYFVHGTKYLVVNPQIGGRCLLDAREFGVLESLARFRVNGEPTPPDESAEAERTLAKLILNWIVYYNGNRPRREFAEPSLNQVYYAITDGCNLRCPYCYASSEKCLPGELNTEESLRLVTQVAEMGANLLIFTGGEPMLRKDLFQIVEHANRSGLKSNIITNATMIRSREQADRFAELFNSVTVSVDGGTAEAHDRTRGAGSFDRTHHALRLLNEAGVVPKINHIVTSDNVDELVSFANFADGLDVHSVRLMYHNKLGRGVDDDYDFGWEDHLKIQYTAWTSPATGCLRLDGPKPLTPCSIRANCGMGGNEIYINSLGDVYPCKLITGREQLAGNVRQKPLAEIFGNPVLREMRTSSVYGGDYHADCAKCYIKPFCGGGCRATHMSESGDPRRNSRHQCRILRHGIATQLWLENGITSEELAADHTEMTTPRLVAGGGVHPVYEDWKTYVPPSPDAISVRELLPITPV
ncbi:StsB family radical SAM/SPASM domain sactipeptide maturase [Nonomuraea typhae]|uniref:StsB family radical SAM/SPASM domain sactipeptide maturase n=1 Tax=Nonomuraea typhae TaxID=2603600 RepID=UPI0012FAEA25|nr:StsB family radical SAM/SPASM domain sactipeptide maturase [Nonomuraea typhae]